MTIGTSSVQRLAELFDTIGHSNLAYFFSRFLICSFGISTAQKQKSTCPAIFSASFSASSTIIFLAISGRFSFIAHRFATASSYVFPALRPLAAITVNLNHGCFARSVIKRCPTIPVPPMTPALYSLIIHNLLENFREFLSGVRIKKRVDIFYIF